jgi:hypothetical protein
VTHIIMVLRQLFLIITTSAMTNIDARVLRHSADYLLEMEYEVSGL